MSSINQLSPSTVIKSIQYGSVTAASGTSTATISAVDTTKAVVIVLGQPQWGGGATGSMPGANYPSGPTLTNATTVSVFTSSPSNSPVIRFVVVEYY